MHNQIIADLKEYRANLQSAIDALNSIENNMASPPPPWRSNLPRKPPARAAVSAGKVSASLSHDWAAVKAAGLTSRHRPSRDLVARARQILARRRIVA